MSIPGTLIPVFNTGPSGYSISRSLRFNSADSANLSRSYSTPTNAKIGTFSFWCKLSNLATTSQTIIQQDSNSIYAGFDNNGTSDYTFGVYLQNNTTKQARVTTQVFRDYGAWYHFLIAVNTPDSTAANRLRLYVNGVEITTFSTSNTVDQNINVFSSGNYRIGSYAGSVEFFGGYLSEIHFIDGQALDPTSFGEFSATTGIWVPKRYVGAYGTNGFKLDFSDNSAATATTLGKDSSGNGNNWTPNNLSVTSGAGNDSFVDVPTNGSEVDTGAGGQVRGNYATANILDSRSWSSGLPWTLSNGNLTLVSNTDSSTNSQGATIRLPNSGKYYGEIEIQQFNITGGPGFIWITVKRDSGAEIGYSVAYSGANSWGSYGYYNSYTSTGTATSSISNGAILQWAYDAATRKVWMGINNSWFNSGNPAAGTGEIGTHTGTDQPFFAFGARSATPSTTQIINLNYGQRPFAYTAPSGFKALCTANLPAPTITQPSTVMDVKLYTGNGSTLNVTGLGFSPDLVWIKQRSAAKNHNLYDTVRGALNVLQANVTDAEANYANSLTSFNSDGFTLSSANDVNQPSGGTFVAWTWDAGSSTVTNTAGSISSQVRANASAGFSIVTYTGNGSSGQSVGHGLGVTPGMFIIKTRSDAEDWIVWHQSVTGATPPYGKLNTTQAFGTSSDQLPSLPTSTIINLGNSTGGATNTSGRTYVCYAFAPVAGYSSMGSFTTSSASTDGVFVYTNHRPRWVLIKETSATGPWIIYDAVRNTYNAANNELRPNTSEAENGGAYLGQIDILSNGFKIRSNSSAYVGEAGDFIYCSFAESPFAANNRAR